MKWITFFFLALIMSCSNDKIKIPDKVLSEKQMISILIDVHLADALAAKEKLKELKTLNQVKKIYFLSVLEKHKIDENVFETSMSFYKNHPSVFYELYEEVLIELTKREAELNGENQIKEATPEDETIEDGVPVEEIEEESIGEITGEN